MRKSLLSIAAATMFLGGVGLALADGEAAVPTWDAAQGTTLTQYSTTMKYTSSVDPNMTSTVGTVLPDTVTVYPLPESMKIPSADRYRYGMINDHPVVVETTTRKVVHNWN
jgi:hypothetical protein